MNIIKRCGAVVPFDGTKIQNAVLKALQAVGMPSEAVATRIAADVTDTLKDMGKTPTVEQIQDVVETALAKRGMVQAAKAYILYRHSHAKDREKKKVMMDVRALVSGYVEQTDWRIHENANSGVSYASLQNFIGGAVMANYGLNEIYPSTIKKLHDEGDFHIHDLSCSIIPYCAGYSLRDMLLMGFTGTPDKATAGPAKYLMTALQQAANFLATLQTEWAGAQAFSSFDTYMAPFIRVDEETGEIKDGPAISYKKVKQAIQTFLFCINVASRWGQCPFSNVTMDLVPPKDLADSPVVIGGKYIEGLYYKDFQVEMDMFNKAFLDLMLEGDSSGKAFSFPIPTYNLTKDFQWEGEVSDKLFELTAKFGIPYFQNFINSDMDPSDTRSMCCRLRLDTRELRKKTGGLFGAGELTGSINVCTINLSRIGYISKTEDQFFERLDYLMEQAKEVSELKRKVCEASLENGLMPYSKVYVKSLKNHFSTIGVIGMNECCLNFLGCSIADPEGHALAVKTLKHMRAKLQDFQEETGNLYNLEATPGEGTCYRLARKDKEVFPEIITAGEGDPYYTNSTQLPVGYTDDVFEMLDKQDELQCLYTGGTVAHVYLGEAIDDPKQCMRLVKTIAESYKMPAFTITPTYSVCPNHGYISGAHDTCPMCVTETPNTKEA